MSCFLKLFRHVKTCTLQKTKSLRFIRVLKNNDIKTAYFALHLYFKNESNFRTITDVLLV